MQDLIGHKLGKYTLESKLGSGGMASVYRSTHPQLRRPVAIKVLSRVDTDEGDSTQQRFLREAQAMASLNHPTLIRVYDVDQDGDIAYMVMDLIPGGSLDDRLRSGTPMGFYWACDVVARLAEALDIAHRRGIIHRDIKPSNVLLTPEEDPVIADFGIAKVVEDAAELTTAGTIIGTPLYMAPEQIRGSELDGRADIYALGVVLYQLLTGRTPFSGDMITVITKQLHDAPPPMRVHTPDLPEPLERVVLQALAKEPDNRYGTGAEFAAAIRSALQSISDSSRVREAPLALETQAVDPKPVAVPAERVDTTWLVRLGVGAVVVLIGLIIVFKIIQQLFVPLLLAALAFGGFYWYRQRQRTAAPAQAPSPQAGQSPMQRGLNWYRGGQYPQALAAFNEELERNPQNVDALISRGLLFYTLGDLPKALPDFNAALELNGRHSRALYQRALTWMALNQPDNAIADLEALMTFLPAQADLRREVAARLATLRPESTGADTVMWTPADSPLATAMISAADVAAADADEAGSTAMWTPADSPLATEMISAADVAAADADEAGSTAMWTPADSPLATEMISAADVAAADAFEALPASLADAPRGSVTGKLDDPDPSA